MRFMHSTTNSIRHFIPNISILMEILVFVFCRTRFIVFFSTFLRSIEADGINSIKFGINI